ncbi:MAG: hypothetical protein KKF42_08135 [Actinobacteria bacterium]|nr:hypothetical protein [Actinomycetota bacterium]
MPKINSTYKKDIREERQNRAKRVVELEAHRAERRKELEELVRSEETRRRERRLAAH